MRTATLFDFNGVLVDDESVHLAAFRDVLTPLGIALGDERYAERYLGYDDAGAFRAILEDAGRRVSAPEVSALVAAKRPRYRARAEASLSIFDGAVALVRACAERGPVAIVSGALRDEIDFALTRMGVDDQIAFIVSAEDTRACKPDPEGYALALARLEENGEVAAVAIEDSLAGITAAKAAGLPCIAVAHSYALPELLAAGADLALARLGDLDADAIARTARPAARTPSR